MAYHDHGDFDTSDEVSLYFDQYTGQLLERRDQALVKLSAGDLVMKWLGPLHVGSFGGTGVKVLWAVLALSFPTLAITGVLMWWFRLERFAPDTRGTSNRQTVRAALSGPLGPA